MAAAFLRRGEAAARGSLAAAYQSGGRAAALLNYFPSHGLYDSANGMRFAMGGCE